MIKEQSRFLQRVLFAGDVLIIIVSWILAYYIRFELLTPPEWLPLSRYLVFLPGVVVLWSTVFVLSGLYRVEHAQRFHSVVYAVGRAVFFGMVAAVAALFFYREFSFSRLHMILFATLTSIFMVTLRVAIFAKVRHDRLQGKNVRRVLIAGAGETGRRLEEAIRQYPWMGLEIVGFVDDHKQGPDIIGKLDDLPRLLDTWEAAEKPIHQVYIAVPLRYAEKIERLLDELSTRLAHVYLVPDLLQFDIINSRITDIEGLPVIHLIDEAPMDFRRVVKRIIDMVFSLAVLIGLSPLFLVIAIAVKLSSPGPVFYRQERMSLNGQRFEMLKFRSMPVDAEKETGPVWARPGEPRATRVGAFLRRTSLDELPQFINVLKGDMSIVGPRPERPVFIEQFRRHIPRYMLRHKVKGGITGWAQVNGWRGNTSIEKRIEYDLYYIQNWSLKLDFKIMWLTIWRGFIHENAY